MAATSAETGDDTAFVARTAQGLQPTVWTRLRAQIGTFTLDQRLGDLSVESTQRLRQIIAGAGTGDWPRMSDDLDDRALVLADLADRLDALAGAEWLPAGAQGDSIESLAHQHGVTASTLARTLNISPGDARRLIQGKREPTEGEVDAMEELFGTRPGGAASFNEELVANMDQPSARPTIYRWLSAHDQEDEAIARRRLAGAVLALAARHRETGRGRNWTALLAEVVDAD